MTLAQGYEAMPTTSTSDVPEHPYLSLVPASYNAPSAVPGPVVPADNVPGGPSPSAPSGTGAGGGTGTGTGGGENGGAADPFTPSGYDGLSPNANQSSGCSVSSTGSNAASFGLVGILAGLAALVSRRRR
jgi:LPXTG-motif cell wall-anchored protein